jgi:hypothetical protein
MSIPYAPDVVLPLALDPSREYRLSVVDGKWVVDVRAGNH